MECPKCGSNQTRKATYRELEDVVCPKCGSPDISEITREEFFQLTASDRNSLVGDKDEIEDGWIHCMNCRKVIAVFQIKPYMKGVPDEECDFMMICENCRSRFDNY